MKLVLIFAVVSVLGGCATHDLVRAHNTLRAIDSVTADSIRAELITGSHYAR